MKYVLPEVISSHLATFTVQFDSQPLITTQHLFFWHLENMNNFGSSVKPTTGKDYVRKENK